MKFVGVFVLALIVGVALSAPAPEPLGPVTVVLPAGLVIGSSGLTLGGAIAAKTAIKLGFAKGIRMIFLGPELMQNLTSSRS